MTATVLVVERDSGLAETLCRNLSLFGYRALEAVTGAEALNLVQFHLPALILLDPALGDVDGLDVCRDVRRWSRVPIIILSNRSEEADRVLGFELGADDYVVKPFSTRELMCRVRAVLRRVWIGPEGTLGLEEPVHFGEVDIDPRLRQVTRNGRVIPLGGREYELLWFLVRNPGRVFKPQQLIDLISDPQHAGSKNAVRVRMWTLRDRLEEDRANPRYFRTASSGGYVFDPDRLSRAS